MVDEEKLRLMVDIALQEKKQEKLGITQEMYYRSHYIRSNVFSTIWNLTIGYFFLLLLILLYRIDYFFINVAKLDYRGIGVAILVVYAAIVLLGFLLSYYYYTKKYAKHKNVRKDYFRKIEKLSEYYKEDKEAESDDTFIGV